MRTAKVIAQSLFVLIGSSTMCGASTGDNVATFTTVLRYPPGPHASDISPNFPGPHGQAYRFRLNPQNDIKGNPIVFELLMEGTSRAQRGRNLLDPTGRLHGYQKWYFAASDFAHGPAKSIYGNSRTIDLPNIGQAVEVKVVRVAVEAIPATSSMPANYRFTYLTLQILDRALSVGGR